MSARIQVRNSRSFAALGMTVGALIGLATPLQAQQIADRVAAVGSGKAMFHFAARPGVCGDGQHFMRTGRHSYQGSFTSDMRYDQCMIGPVQVRLTVRNGTVERVETWAGPLRSREGTDLGVVPAADAARYMLSIAVRGNSFASAKAILPAVLADSATVWPTLLTIANDMEGRSRGTRQDAVFWLSRYASAATVGRKNSPFDDDDDDDDDNDSGGEDLKSHAVFVLSQLPHGQGVDNLLEVARTNKNPKVRSKALFWLGQSGDPRALRLFESILRG